MFTKIVYDEYWRSWFLDDYKASSGEEAKNKQINKKISAALPNKLSKNIVCKIQEGRLSSF